MCRPWALFSAWATPKRTKNKEIEFKDSFTGRREAHAVTWLSNSAFALANGGEGKKDAHGVLPGGRSLSLMKTRSDVLYGSGMHSEMHALMYGHCTGSRSAAKGIEMEGVASGRFAGKPYLLVGSERGSFLVWCLTLDGKKSRWILGQGKAQTAAIPGGIARICNAALAQKTRLYVPDSVEHHTRSLRNQ